MARTPAELPSGPRVTDYISLGVVAATFPRTIIDEVLKETGKTSRRQRDLPAHSEPVQTLHDRLVKPVAEKETKGAWFHRWRVVSLDGTTLAVADTPANEKAFGRPGESRGKAAFPLIRLVSLVENGTHVLFGTVVDAYRVGETTLARQVVKRLEKGMVCLADRNFFGYELWRQAQAGGRDLLWRVKCNLVLPCEQRLADGSYLSRVYPSPKDRRNQSQGMTVRVVEYRLVGVPNADPLYRLVTTLLEPEEAPAAELAALYHERWEIETALDELKTHLRGSQIVLRSKTPDLVKQEVYGLMMAHFAVRGLMHEAALKAEEDPDKLSFIHAVRVVRRKLQAFVAFPPGEEG